MFLVYVS